jgi:hypothetical protein
LEQSSKLSEHSNKNNNIHQFGSGKFDNIIFKKSETGTNIAAYVYTRHQGIYYFGCVRKLPLNGRINRFGQLKGAAAPKTAKNPEKYFGKWGGIGGGGGKGPTKTNLEAIINELNTETGHEDFLKSSAVNLTEFGNPRINTSQDILTCKNVVEIEYKTKSEDIIEGAAAAAPPTTKKTIIFIFYMKPPEFFMMFPINGTDDRKGATMLTESGGETDTARAFTMQQIIDFQRDETRKNPPNNFYVSYFFKNFNLVKDVIMKESPAFKQKWESTNFIDIESLDKTPPDDTKIPILKDVKPRIPTENIHPVYKFNCLKKIYEV